MKNERRIWLVEMRIDGKWMPTVGARLSRRDARRELGDWRRDNPNDRFRVVPYMAAP